MPLAPRWLASGTPQQRRALFAAALGWMLDSMDVMLYAMLLPTLQRVMHLSPGLSGGLMSITLLAASAGGIFFGWFADRVGRTRALTASMLVYSLATAACGLTFVAWQLAIARIVLGLGMGGEWATGAALVAESWPAEHRNKALAFVQSFWAIGFAAGSLVTLLILPRFGWRAVFFVGIFPALLTLWIRRSVHEPETFRTRSPLERVSAAELFRKPLLPATLIVSTMNAATLFAYWGLFTWLPTFLSRPVAQGGRGLDVVHTGTWTIVMQAGVFLGYIFYGSFADRFGQKTTYIAYLVLAAIAVPIFAAIHSANWLLIAGPIAGFFGTGYFSGFGVIAAILFPGRIRGTAMGFVYNIGRIASAAAPYAVGLVSERAGLSMALALTAVSFALAAAIACFLPLTRERERAALS